MKVYQKKLKKILLLVRIFIGYSPEEDPGNKRPTKNIPKL